MEVAMPWIVIQQHKFGRMYLCGWSKRWGAVVCANRFTAIVYSTEDDARLACAHAVACCPRFTDSRPIDWQVIPERPPHTSGSRSDA
jgi:hypothetical protein